MILHFCKIYAKKCAAFLDHLNIWLKSFTRILKYDSTGKEKRAQWDFPGEWITRLHEGLNGQIWIGTNDGGLYYINRGETEVHSMLKKTIRLVTYLHQETADLLWVGTEKGLYRIQLSTQKAEKIKGLEDTHIRSLYFSSPGQIWVTSQDRGFYLYNQGVLVQFPVDRNKYLMASHSIFEDKNGFFWITTNKGLFQVSKNDLLHYANNRIGKKSIICITIKARGLIPTNSMEVVSRVLSGLAMVTFLCRRWKDWFGLSLKR